MLVWSRAFRPAQDGTLVNASKKILLRPGRAVNRTGCPISRVFCEKWGFCSSPITEVEALLARRHRLTHPRIAGQLGRFVGCFPGEVGVAAPEMSVRCGLLVNRPPQVQ